MNERRQKILKYVEELPQKNPKRWQTFLDVVRQYEGVFSPEEATKRAKKVAESWFKPDKDLIPKSIQWAGRSSSSDYPCPKCELIKEPGIMRYLGNFLAGTEKVTVEKHDEDGEPYFEDRSFSSYLDGWRCDLCGHEYTDGY